ncbi:MAG: glycosyltransferase family 4 protein [Candidatus Hodarchaeota archaeon]
MSCKLNILLLTRYFPPEIGTAANLFFELARGLVVAGYKVTIATGFPWYNLKEIPKKYRGNLYVRENIEGIEIIRLTFPTLGHNHLNLAAGHVIAPITSFLGGLLTNKPDLVYAYSPPLFMGLAGWLLKMLKGIPFVLGIQDLHPQCYIDQGLLQNRFLISLLETLEKFIYNRASLITVHSNGNKQHIVSTRRIAKNKVKVLPNWIDTDEIRPLSRENRFSKKYELNKKFVVGYAGTLGMSQGLMNVIDTANMLRDKDDIEFFIVGDGVEKGKMMGKTRELGLKTVRFLGMQPKSVYPYVLASSDVQLVTLNSKVQTPVVPSKILSIMAAARPVLASIPLGGDAPKLIEDSGCGFCVEPKDPRKLSGKIVYLYKNRDICEKLGKQGRKYVVENLSLSKIVYDIKRMFDDILRTNHGKEGKSRPSG